VGTQALGIHAESALAADIALAKGPIAGGFLRVRIAESDHLRALLLGVDANVRPAHEAYAENTHADCHVEAPFRELVLTVERR
jgi:hypothetical protein